LVGVLRLHRTGPVDERHRAPEPIGQYGTRTRALSALEHLIDAAGQHGRCRTPAHQLLRRVGAVVEIAGRPTRRPRATLARRVVGEARTRRATEARQLIPDVPDVTGQPVTPKVAVRAVADDLAAPHREAV